MSITLRDWASGDDLALLEVFGDPLTPQHHQDRAMLGPAAPGAFAHTVVAEDSGIPIASGVLREQPLHPQRLWLFIEVAPGQRRRGIATQIYRHLCDQIPAELTTEMKARSYVPGDTGERFLVAQGFGAIQHTRKVRVSPGALPVPEFDDPQTAENPRVWVDDLATGSTELSALVAEFYNSVHDWDPSQMRLTQAQQYLLAPETGAIGALVLRDANYLESTGSQPPIAAFAISYGSAHEADETTDRAADVLMGWNPTLSAEQANEATKGLLGLLSVQHPVEVEVDNSTTALTAEVDKLIAAGHAEVLMFSTVWATDA